MIMSLDSDTKIGCVESAFIFRGKIGLWWYAAILLMLVATAGILFMAVRKFSEEDMIKEVGLLVGLITVLVVCDVLFLSTLFRNRVLITDDELIVMFSFVTMKMKVSDITSVKESRNPIASLAASMDRLALQGKYGLTLISVVKKTEFIELLCSLNPNIQINKRTIS